MTDLEKRITEAVASDTELMKYTPKVVIFNGGKLTEEEIEKRNEKMELVKKKGENYIDIDFASDISDKATKGELYIYAFDIPKQLLKICYRYGNNTFILSASEVKMSRAVLNELIKIKVPFLDSFKWDIAVSLDCIVNESRYIYAAEKVDIIDINRKKGIALKEFISKEKIYPYMFLGSKYIETKGNPKNYYKAVNKWIKNKPKLQLFLALSIVGLVAQLIEDFESKTIFIVCGENSTGKSTASLLPPSVWCNPVYCLNSGEDTDRSLQLKMQELNFIPIVVDEFVKSRGSSGKKLSNEMFRFNRGSDKATAHNTTTERNTAPFITSSEISVTKQIFNANTESEGELARFLEIKIGDKDLADTPEQAENMTEMLMDNYGWLGLDVAKHIVDKGYIEDNTGLKKELRNLRESLRKGYKFHTKKRRMI